MEKFLLAMGGTEQGWSRHNDEGIFRDYDAEVDVLFESAKKWNLTCIELNNDYIYKLPYYNEHRDVLDKVSFGFSFKAIGYYEIFKQMEYGDIAFFVDSNHVISQDPNVFYNVANTYDAFIHDHIWVYYPNKDWTRRDTFVNMGCDEKKYWESPQLQFNISGFKKTSKTVDFIDELFEDSLTYKIMFGENKYANFPSFREHRHDQSIFSILCKKYEFPYMNRTQNVWGEYVVPETTGITPKVKVDNSHRMEQDRKDNK